MKRAALLYLSAVASIALFAAYAVLFLDGPLGDVNQATKLVALGACAYLSAVLCKVASA